MKRHVFMLMAYLIIPVQIASAASFSRVYFDDGQTHIIESPHQDEIFLLDSEKFNDPGTHLIVQDGGRTNVLLPFNKSTITINGGIVNGSNVSIDTHGDNLITINGGVLVGDMAANNNSRIYISGGTLTDDVYAYDSGIVEVRGGSVGGIYGVFGSGVIYLYGSNFMVNGQSLNFGDSLRDYVPISPQHPEHLIGTITGTLQNGSAVNNEFSMWANTDADIIVVPEPATLLLLGLGAAMLRKRKG